MSSGGHNWDKFRSVILGLSRSKVWLEAKPEWELHAVYRDGTNERACICGHQHINQICVIRNRENANLTEVGNVCVHNFMQLASRRIFAVLKRVEVEITKSLNPDSLDLFVRRGVIAQTERDEYLEYWRRRKYMSSAQRTQKIEINRRVLGYVEKETARLIENFRNRGLTPRAT